MCDLTAENILGESNGGQFDIGVPTVWIHGKAFRDVPSLGWLADAVAEKMSREKEPCPWCYGMTQPATLWEADGTFFYEGISLLTADHCPKCGRKLEGDKK